MNFNLEQLKAFVATVQTGSFSGAARHLGKAQSGISTAIANLECDLGVILFDRSAREPQMTPAASALLPKVKEILEQSYNLQGYANAIAGGQESKLVLAIEESIISEQFDDILVRFAAEFPDLELQLLTPDRINIIEMVKAGEVDIGLIIPPPQVIAGYKTKPLGEFMLFPVISSQHSLAQATTINFEQLKQHRQLVLLAQRGDISCAEKFSPQVWHVESIYWLLDLIDKGLGWGWIPRHLAAPKIADGSLQYLQLGDQITGYHVPVDAIFSYSYQQGDAGLWLEQQLTKLVSAIEG